MAVEFKKFDFSPFMNAEYSKGLNGALASAFNTAGQAVNNYGENKDERLLGELSNETDRSKIDSNNFYNKLNFKTGQNIVDNNVLKANQAENQRRADNKYWIDQATNTAVNDKRTMTTEAYNAKYKNLGGIDNNRIYEVTQDMEDRAKQNKIDDYNFKSKQAADARRKAEYNQRMQNYKANQIAQQNKNFQEQQQAQVLNNISSKYKNFNDFKNSEDWQNTPYNVKSKLAQSKVWGDSAGKVLTPNEIKTLQINTRAKDVTNIEKQYLEKTGQTMTDTQKNNFIYENKVPKEIEEIPSTENIKEKTDKELRTMITGLQDMRRFKESYDSSFTGIGDAALGFIGDLVGKQTGEIFGDKTAEDEARFRTQLPLMVGPIVKAIYGGNASNADRNNVQNALPTFRDSSKEWNAKMDVFYQKSLESLQTNLNVLKAKNFDTTAYEKEIENFKNDWNGVKSKTPGNDVKIKSFKKNNENPPEIIKELKNPKTGEVKKWSNIRGFINE